MTSDLQKITYTEEWITNNADRINWKKLQGNKTNDFSDEFKKAFHIQLNICIWKNEHGYHRLDGPAYEYASGAKVWWVDGKLHRTDGPACEYASGAKYWWVDGKRHRIDGPACEGANGTKEWYVDGKELTESEFKEKYGNNS